jgi:hypothetical protein
MQEQEAPEEGPSGSSSSALIWTWWIEAYKIAINEQSLHLIEQVLPRIEAMVLWWVHAQSLPPPPPPPPPPPTEERAPPSSKLNGRFSFDWMVPMYEELFSSRNTNVKKFALVRFFQFLLLLHNGHVAVSHCQTLPGVLKVQEQLESIFHSKTPSPLLECLATGAMQSNPAVTSLLPLEFVLGTILTWTDDQSLYKEIGEGSKGDVKTLGEWLLLFLECHVNGFVVGEERTVFCRAYIRAIGMRETMSPVPLLCHMQLFSRKGVVLPSDCLRAQEASLLRQLCSHKLSQLAGVGNHGLSEFACRLYSALVSALVRCGTPETLAFDDVVSLVCDVPTQLTSSSRFLRCDVPSTRSIEGGSTTILVRACFQPEP